MQIRKVVMSWAAIIFDLIGTLMVFMDGQALS